MTTPGDTICMGKNKSNNLTEQLRAALAGSGMTLGELARKTGVDKSALSRFVNGDRGLSMESLNAIGQCLGLRIVADRPK
jgi:transcriptional regulator with XRE-family HTH domain